MLGAARDGSEAVLRDVGKQLRATGAQHARPWMPTGGVRRIAAHLARQVGLHGIRVRDGNAPDRPVDLEDVDRAPVGEIRDGQGGERRERGLEVERRREEPFRLREECSTPLGCLGGGARRLLARQELARRLLHPTPFHELPDLAADGLGHLEELVVGLLDLAAEEFDDAEHLAAEPDREGEAGM